MYNSIGINLRKEMNYLAKRVKVPKIVDKSNCCCENDHFNNAYYAYSSQQKDCNSHNFKKNIDKMICPMKNFINNNIKVIAMVVGILSITLYGIKIIKELS